jgi:hypothetical protein
MSQNAPAAVAPFARLQLQPAQNLVGDVAGCQPGVLAGQNQFPEEPGADEQQQDRRPKPRCQARTSAVRSLPLGTLHHGCPS